MAWVLRGSHQWYAVIDGLGRCFVALRYAALAADIGAFSFAAPMCTEDTSMLAGYPTTSFVAATDLERAQTFYGDTLGLEVVANDGFALICRSAGRLIRIVAVPDLTPEPFTVLGWEVPDIREVVMSLEARGIEFMRFQPDQDDLGIWTAPNGHQVAWFSDPDGNVLSLSSEPAT